MSGIKVTQDEIYGQQYAEHWKFRIQKFDETSVIIREPESQIILLLGLITGLLWAVVDVEAGFPRQQVGRRTKAREGAAQVVQRTPTQQARS